MATDRTVLVRLKANVGDFVAGMGTARAAVRGVTSEIDTTNDRVAWLSQGILAIGPALVPLGAAAIPMFTGIATQATVAAGAVGVMVLAFHGIGDTMKAVNEYQLAPTAANFEKLRQAMEDFGPAGAEFVMFLDSLGPQLQQLQDLAREGIFPGAQTGLEELMTLLPRAKGLVSEMAGAIGELMAQAGGDIAGPRFEKFFDFLDRNARPILEDMSRAVGNFASGFLNILVGFEPLTMEFSSGLVEMSRSFREWSEGLDDNATFQQFLDYIQESIPKAMAFGAALSDAFVAIITAAAPVGDIMLPALTEILRVIAALADSPIGPVFLAAAAAMSVYGRAVAIANVSTSGLGKGVSTLASAMFAGTGGVKTLATDLRSMAGEYDRVGKAQSLVLSGMSQTSGAAQRARASLGALGRSAALVGGLAVATSGLGESMGLTSTMSLALMGYMVGGAPGAAVGGLIGVTMDLSKANGLAGESAKQLAQDVKAAGNDLGSYYDAVSDAQDRLTDHMDDTSTDSFGEFLQNSFDPDVILEFTQAALGAKTVTDEMTTSANDAYYAYQNLSAAGAYLAYQMGLADTAGSASLEQMSEGLKGAQPAMSALGITLDDLAEAARNGSIVGLVESFKEWQTEADSTAGRTDAVVKAVSELDNELNSTADSASALAQALDALLSPKMNLSEALDAWTTSVRTLEKDLAKNNRTLEGNSNAAIKNRAAVRDRVSAMQDVLTAEAEAGAGAGKLTTTLARQRDALLDAGKAAGISEKDMRGYLRQLGLTPALVKTLIENNAPQARGAVAALKAELNGLDGKTIKTYIRVIRKAEGIASDAFDALPQLAGGGQVRGPGGPTGDQIPALLSDKEYVVKAAAVDKYGVKMFHAINAMRFASGGQARKDDGTKEQHGAIFSTEAIANLLNGAENVAKALRILNAALEKSQKAVDKDRAARDAVASMMESLSSSVQSQLRSDIFAEPENANPWSVSVMGSPTDQLNADTAEAEEFTKLIESLSSKGLKGAALAEVAGGGVSRLKAYDAMAASDLAAYASAFERREKALQVAGTTTGQAAYGSDYSLLDNKLSEQISKLRDIEQAIKAMDRENQKGHGKTKDASGQSGNQAAANARRRRRQRSHT